LSFQDSRGDGTSTPKGFAACSQESRVSINGDASCPAAAWRMINPVPKNANKKIAMAVKKMTRLRWLEKLIIPPEHFILIQTH
jgi:hypothetical protein